MEHSNKRGWDVTHCQNDGKAEDLQTALSAITHLKCVACRSRHRGDSAKGEIFLIALAIKGTAKDMFQAGMRFARSTKTKIIASAARLMA